MSATGEDFVAVLLAAYLEEAERYAAASRLVGEIAEACERGEAIDERLHQVFALLDEIAARDALLAPVKSRWEQAGRPTSDALRSATNRIAELIQKLQHDLHRVEQAARARRDYLAVELDVCNRQRQMQRAYQRKS